MTTPIIDYLTSEYYRAGRHRAAPSWPEAEPPPEVTTADEVSITHPSAVVKLQRAAEAAGWAVRVGYSRGPERAVRVGEYKLTEHLGVWAGPHPGTGYRFVAVYSRTVGAKSWAWASIRIWKPGGLRFGHALIGDLHEFIAVSGSVSLAWFKGVETRELGKKAKAKARIAKPREGQL